MKGLFLKYEMRAKSSAVFLKMDSYRFEGGRDMDCSNDDDYVPDSESQRKVLLCRCGSNDWTDNGRFTNEYECNGCGQLVVAYESRNY